MMVIRRLIWDAWNVPHIARHQVTPHEVEEIKQSAFLLEKGHSGRARIIGSTKAGKLLAVILSPIGQGVYYVVTARPSSRKERQQYQSRAGR